MWSLITVISAGHLHRVKSLEGVGGKTSRQHPRPISVYLTCFTVHSDVFLTALRSGCEQSYLTRLTCFMMNNESGVFVKSFNWVKGEKHCVEFEKPPYLSGCN